MARFAKTGTRGHVDDERLAPRRLRAFVDEQVTDGRYSSTSEYIRGLIRRDQDRQRLRGLLLDGAASGPGPVADDGYFASLRDRLG